MSKPRPTVIRWEDPELTGRYHGTRWSFLAEELKQRAGEWALVAETDARGRASSIAQNLRRRHGLEATRVGLKVYARWPKVDA